MIKNYTIGSNNDTKYLMPNYFICYGVGNKRISK